MSETNGTGTTWVVSVEFAGPKRIDHEALATYLVTEQGYDVVSASPGRIGTTVHVESVSYGNAMSRVASEFRSHLSGEWKVVEVRVLTEAEHDAELERPVIPPLVGVTEAGEILGVSKQRVSALAKSPTFPAAVASVNAAPVWLRSSIEAFARVPRRGGRPAKVAG
jgi:hypothetical protein